MLPPPDGLPPAARAADMLNAAAMMPDVMARAQMSIALQRSVGNARMADMLHTVPEPKAPPPPPPQIEVAPARPAPPPVPQPAAAVTPTTVAPAQTVATMPAKTVAALPSAPAPASPATTEKRPAEVSPTNAPAAAPSKTTAPAPGKKAVAGTAAEEPQAATDAEKAEPAKAEPSAKGEAAAPTSVRAAKGASGKAGAGVEAKGEEGGEPEVGAGGGGAAVTLKMPEPPADITPSTRQRLRKVQSAAGQTAATHADLPPAHDATEQARAAVTEPSEETNARAEANLVNALGERPKPSPKIEELCTKIYKVIRSKRPPGEDALVEAKPEEMAQAAGDVMKGNVEGDVKNVDQSYDPLDKSPTGKQGQTGQPLESPPENVSAPPINATQATPDAVPVQNVSLDADVEANQARRAEAGMETEPAKLAQSGPVADARAAQGELEETAKADPAKVLAEQKSSLAKANSDMAALQQKALSALSGSRRTTVAGTTGQQKKMVGSEEQMRTAASTQAQGIFSKAQTDVNALLQPLPQTAMQKWDKGVAIASEVFKQQLKKVQDWIDERHRGLGGTLLSIGDYFTGLPGWVTEEYDRAEQKFGDDVCNLAREISTEVNGVIMACEAIIADARTKIAEVFSRLPQSLQTWAAEEQAKLGTQLDSLNKRAHDVRDNFDKELVNRAAQAVQDVRVQIHELRQKAKGLVGRIADAINRFLDDPVKFIIEALLDILSIPRAAFWAVVAKIKKVIGDIADDPEKFANNLMDAIGKGFSQFFDNIGDHLINGFIDWLTGGLSAAGVELPKDFSVKSIITFFLQLMGITWPRIRKLLAKHIGEENIALLEKAYSIVANLVALGPEGIFEMIKEKLNPQEILNQIINAAVDYMIKAVIKAVSARIILLFNPVGAILQAIEAIYRVLKWIFTNAARIFKLIETIVNGIADILAGNIGAMANAVEKALAALIAPVIDFLADYLGFGDLPDKVRDTILGFQAWIEGILDQVIGWLVEKGKALLAAVGIGGEKKDEAKPGEGKFDGQIGKVVTWKAAGESHELWIATEGGSPAVMMASPGGGQILAALTVYEEKANGLKDDDKETSTEVLADVQKARQLVTTMEAVAKELAAKVADEKADPSETETKDNALEALEEELKSLMSVIQTKLGLNDEEDIKKARTEFGQRLFSSSEELAPLLKVSERTARRRTAKWAGDGILFKWASAKTDPLGMYSFDPLKAEERETHPNNRSKYGYSNPKKTSPEGLEILSKGLNLKSPQPPRERDPAYHVNEARYESKRSGSSYKDFRFPVAILGHKDEIGASDHWNEFGHKQTKAENQAWNRDPANYQGPEHEDESAKSGGSSARYKTPMKIIGSHSDWL